MHWIQCATNICSTPVDSPLPCKHLWCQRIVISQPLQAVRNRVGGLSFFGFVSVTCQNSDVEFSRSAGQLEIRSNPHLPFFRAAGANDVCRNTGQFNTQAIATDDSDVSCRCAMGGRASGRTRLPTKHRAGLHPAVKDTPVPGVSCERIPAAASSWRIANQGERRLQELRIAIFTAITGRRLFFRHSIFTPFCA